MNDWLISRRPSLLTRTVSGNHLSDSRKIKILATMRVSNITNELAVERANDYTTSCHIARSGSKFVFKIGETVLVINTLTIGATDARGVVGRLSVVE